ncbi:MFS transporter [Limosilactobacillus fermentum]|uniref:MFS transporter n=1 Tax=Limosilactobacillus fermentum TaxID=1613 RepID=UPI0021A63F2F|nr:MFS transporter [Limosilactobacillus fermentum]MCT2874846.1 MFS transporter [Limosilactobacillus fermentum]
MKKQSYAGVATAVYVNYAIVGMATIFISQYSTYFQSAWHTNVKGISLVLAAVGLGRLLTIFLAGSVSDKIGRRKTMLISMVSDVIFLLGAALAHNMIVAAIAAIFFGFTNSFGDTSCYPALTDAFPTRSATMNSLVKAFMSLAQFLFPFWVSTVTNALITALSLSVFLVLDILFVCKVQFASQDKQGQLKDIQDAEHIEETVTSVQPAMAIDGTLLIAMGFTICFTFYVFSQYLPNFGTSVLKVSPEQAKTLVSFYAMASMISVFVTAALVTKVKHLLLISIYGTVAALALFMMILVPSLTTARIGSVAIGFFAAGGIWQVGLSILTSYFPTGNGKLTSYYSFMASLTYFVGPLVSSFVISDSAASVLAVFWITAIIAAATIVIAIWLLVRSQRYHFE